MKKIFTFVGALSFAFFCIFSLSPAQASVISYATVGEKFTAQVQNPPKKSTITWILTQSGEVLDTQGGKKFSKVFDTKGTYLVRVSAEHADKSKTSTVLTVIVDRDLPNFSPLSAKISAVPAIQNNTITLSGQSESVVFSFGDSTGKIEKYEFEGDLFSDANGDDEIDNDIENKDSSSYSTGGVFGRVYENTGLPARARLRVYDAENTMEEIFVNIKFEEGTAQKNIRQQKPLKAIVKTIPQSDEDGNIFLTGVSQTVILLGKYSEGNVVSYSIDTNIEEDSDSDGKTDNDAENKNTDSFTSGDMFPVEVENTGSPQVIQLEVEDATGQKKSVRKKIIFKKSIAGTSGSTKLDPMIFSSRSTVVSGETVKFKLFNVPENAKISWDFYADGSKEIEDSTEQEVEYRFAEAGKQILQVEILETGKGPVLLKKEIQVIKGISGEIETNVPTAFFESKITNNSVTFISSQSSADSRLANTDISYSWDFGDGFRAEGPNPYHVYQKEGEYQVILTVEDSAERQESFTEQVSIESVTENFSDTQHGGKANEPLPTATDASEPEENTGVNTDPSENEEDQQGELDAGSNSQKGSESTRTGFSFPWWLMILLLIMGVPALFLIKKKIDDPDKDFGKIIEEIIVDFQKKRAPKSVDPEGDEFHFGEDTESVKAEIVDDTQSGDSSETQDGSDTNAQGATPDWMQTYEEDDDSAEDTQDKEEEGNDNPPVKEEDSQSESGGFADTESQEENFSEMAELPEVIDSPANDDLPDENTDSEIDSPFDMEHPEWLEDIKASDEEEVQESSTNTQELDQSSSLNEDGGGFAEDEKLEDVEEGEGEIQSESEEGEGEPEEENIFETESNASENFDDPDELPSNDFSPDDAENNEEIFSEELETSEPTEDDPFLDALAEEPEEENFLDLGESNEENSPVYDDQTVDPQEEQTPPPLETNTETENFLEPNEDHDGVSNIYNDGTVDNVEEEMLEKSITSQALQEKKPLEEEKVLASDAQPLPEKNVGKIPTWMQGVDNPMNDEVK